ncbi:WXG100 family type VII secretion target [Nocardioides terrisoli]|uniref:WXG100 family type VII secretion target n=1 Tax=Nocardioides terrisoli TaxID=3388267 RepID=UPI00287B79D0|nr:WXG100 family type VII secretion target [Nocardioides marmorisolisilvae]
MANVNVTYQQMRDQATKLNNAKTDIEQQLQALHGQIRQLIETDFKTDKASGAFGASYDEFTKGTQKTIEGLHGMAQYLSKAAETFQHADEELAKAMHS